MMSQDDKTCVNCAQALHGKQRSICLHAFDFVSSFSPVCHDFVPSYLPVNYTGECVSFIKEKKYSTQDQGGFA